MKVFVYFNLHRKCWSIKALDGCLKGRVIAHADKVLVRDVTFKVSEAGRQRVIREQRKNVHAGVVGELDGADGTWRDGSCIGWDDFNRRYERYAKRSGMQVSYNPYKWATFVYKLMPEMPIERAPMAYLGSKTVHVFDPCEMEEAT